jgi:hypothetical protein
MADLAHGEGIEREVESAGDLRRDLDAAAREADDDGGAERLALERLGEQPAGLSAVLERPPSPEERAEIPRGRRSAHAGIVAKSRGDRIGTRTDCVCGNSVIRRSRNPCGRRCRGDVRGRSFRGRIDSQEKGVAFELEVAGQQEAEAVADVIVGIAAGRKADMIVVGSRGHGAVAGAVLGSVSRGVVAHATAPVLVVHERGTA